MLMSGQSCTEYMYYSISEADICPLELNWMFGLMFFDYSLAWTANMTTTTSGHVDPSEQINAARSVQGLYTSVLHKCFPRPSDITCSGTARVYHSDQPPSYTDIPGCSHSWAASTTWHAVTAEPQETQAGRLRSTPARWNKAWSSCLGRKWPDEDRKEWKGMLREPGMWPGSVSVKHKKRKRVWEKFYLPV